MRLKIIKIESSILKNKMSFIEFHRRKQIIDIAIELLAEHGYNNTTLADVAKKAGFSKGTVFYYFKNKEELIDQINAVLLEEFREYTKSGVKLFNPEHGKLKAYIKVYFNYMKENSQRFMILFELGINFNLGKHDPIFSQPVYLECRRRLSRFIELDGWLAGKSTISLETLTTVIQGMLDGVLVQYITDPKSVDFDDCCRMVLDMIDLFIKNRQ